MYTQHPNARDIFVRRMQPLKILRGISTVMNAILCLAIHGKIIGLTLILQGILIVNKTMTTVWFLIALISFSGVPSINYKGYYAYHSWEECEIQRPHLEQFIVNRELKKGDGSFYLETYCLEMNIFEDQLKKYKEEKKGINLGAENVGV